MSYSDSSLLTDKNGIPIPQYYNPTLNSYEALEGSSNTLSVTLNSCADSVPIVRLKVKDSFSGSANVSKTYTSNMQAIAISNDDSTSALTLTINSMTFTIKAGEYFDEVFDSFTTFSITSTIAFRCWVRG